MSKKNKNIEVHYDSLNLLNECLSKNGMIFYNADCGLFYYNNREYDFNMDDVQFEKYLLENYKTRKAIYKIAYLIDTFIVYVIGSDNISKAIRELTELAEGDSNAYSISIEYYSSQKGYVTISGTEIDFSRKLSKAREEFKEMNRRNYPRSEIIEQLNVIYTLEKGLNNFNKIFRKQFKNYLEISRIK